MNMRKIAVLGGFAVGAAVTLAPLASADSLTDTIDSEISSLNSIFLSDATLVGDGGDVVSSSTPGVFDTIPLSFAPDSGTATPLDYLLYGLNPIGNAASDPGSYNVFNGALTEFDDAINAELYGLENANALIPAGDLFGSDKVIEAAIGGVGATDLSAATTFFDAGLADLTGFLTPAL
jgi:hypothetical protein